MTREEKNRLFSRVAVSLLCASAGFLSLLSLLGSPFYPSWILGSQIEFYAFPFAVPAGVLGAIGLVLERRTAIRSRFRLVNLTALVIGCFSVLHLVFYVAWLPDVFDKEPDLVAEVRTEDFGNFRIEQQLGTDFYNTTLVHELPSGGTSIYYLDHDASKWWTGSIKFEEASSTLLVTEGVSHPIGESLIREFKIIGGELYRDDRLVEPLDRL